MPMNNLGATMKLRLLLSAAVAAILLPGCATTGGIDETPPRVGMTESEVRAKYGEPDSTHTTPNGETWTYSFMPPGYLWLIPGYGATQTFSPKKQRSLVVVLRNGRVKNYSFGQSRSALSRLAE